jgi:hypothetical protein
MNAAAIGHRLLLAFSLAAVGAGVQAAGSDDNTPGCNYNLRATGWPDALTRLNSLRAQAGLPALATNERIARAAADHAAYLVKNNGGDHFETPGRPGFRGETTFDRLVSAGYFNADRSNLRTYSEIVATENLSNEVDVIDFMVSLPYHRALAFDPSPREAGADRPCGDAGAGTLVVNLGSTRAVGMGTLDVPLVWPADGATGIWVIMGKEFPNPMAPAAWCEPVCPGYPASIQVAPRLGNSGANALDVGRFTITRRGGEPVAVRVLDRHDRNLAYAPTWALAVPTQPLTPGAVYDVSFSGSDRSGAVNKNWSFTTSTVPLRLAGTELVSDGVVLRFDGAAPFLEGYVLDLSEACWDAGLVARLSVGSRAAKITVARRPSVACEITVTVQSRVTAEALKTVLTIAP